MSEPCFTPLAVTGVHCTTFADRLRTELQPLPTSLPQAGPKHPVNLGVARLLRFKPLRADAAVQPLPSLSAMVHARR